MSVNIPGLLAKVNELLNYLTFVNEIHYGNIHIYVGFTLP